MFKLKTSLQVRIINWLTQTKSLELAISAEKNNNFKLIRLISALLVMRNHVFDLFNNTKILKENEFNWADMGLPTFFFLSGLLVSQSLEKSSTLTNFLWKRFLRVYPAAWLSILACALLLGPITSVLPAAEYFSNPGLYHYLITCSLIRIHYYLPGVFVNNQSGTNSVNAPLWTIALELKLYISLAAVSMVRLDILRKILPILALFLVLAGTFFVIPGRTYLSAERYYPLVTYVPLFFIGVCCNFYKEQIKIKQFWILILSVGIWISSSTAAYFPLSFLLLPGAILYLAVNWTSIARKLTPKPDLSYGLYVFAFPVQQMITEYLPTRNHWLIMAITITITLPLAVFSWHYLEKKALSYKNFIK